MTRPLLGVLACVVVFGDTRDHTILEYQHASWTAREGVPARISAFAQTSDGYLWLGTPSGLYRFDGVHFKHIELTASKTGHSDHVRALKASDGGLWIGFRWGGAAYLKDGRITNYGEAEGLAPASTIGSIAVDLDAQCGRQPPAPSSGW